jgi:hypothetical protein
MLKNIDLSQEVAKAEYKRLKGDADLKLAAPRGRRNTGDLFLAS